MMTARTWPWKSESSKECVTTHWPNTLALKMDGAEAGKNKLIHDRGGNINITNEYLLTCRQIC